MIHPSHEVGTTCIILVARHTEVELELFGIEPRADAFFRACREIMMLIRDRYVFVLAHLRFQTCCCNVFIL